MATNLLNSLNRKSASGPEGLGLTRKKGAPGDAPAARKGFKFSAMNNTTKLSLIFAVPAVMLAALALPALVQMPEPMEPPGASTQMAADGVEFANGMDPMNAAFNPDQANTASVLPGENATADQPDAPVINGHGDTPSDASADAGPARPVNNGPRTHVLAEGETLSHVAAKYYGRSSKWRDIAKANGISESEAGRLRPGTKLNIPNLGEPASAAVANPTAGSNNSSNAGRSLPSGPFISLGGAPAADDASNNQMVPVTEIIKEVVVEEQSHTLQPADNPFRLALKYYNDVYEQRRIREANPGIDWLRIEPGTTIKIPALIREVEKTGYVPAGSVAPPSADSGGSSSASPGDSTYTVQKGDTLSSISRKMYGSSSHFAAIQSANGMRNPNDLKVGQVLTIPAR